MSKTDDPNKSNPYSNPKVRSRPSSRSSSSLQQYPTFTEVIDADHATINHYAGRLKSTNNNSDLNHRSYLLNEVTWRLIRHDVSEDIVMRPAFKHYLSDHDEGEIMSSHDRDDHTRAKKTLLNLYHLPIDHSNFIKIITKFFDELAEHMRVESGEQIPKLEKILTVEESRKLGEDYLRTQVLTPELVIDGKKVWEGIEQYANTDIDRFRQLLDLVEKERKEKGKL